MSDREAFAPGMGSRSYARRKGVSFERAVLDAFEAAGLEVRGLENKGDHLILGALNGVTFASECKWQERLKIPEWWAQTVRDAPRGTVPLLTFKQSRKEMLSVIRTADLLRLLT